MAETVNVLAGIARRDAPAVDIIPRTHTRWINVTFEVDDLALAHARGRAVLEGTSINQLVQRLLAEYSGIAPVPKPPPPPPRKRVRMTDSSYR
ncbi:MAG TPA: hypothetical protein VFM19_04330 [Candidatus Limnocylindria bacterium]|nr:hypothetical protein [Candidatus Limnocylindria bacterium]